MPRKRTKLPGKDVQNMDALVVRQEQNLQQREDEIQRIEALFQFEEPYERLLEESRLDFGRVQQLNAMFEQGKSLLRMRAYEGWGGLGKIIDDHCLSRRDAFFYMAIAEKIAPYQKQFEGWGKRSLQLLSSLNEKEIKTLAEGGEVAGIKLDKPMTTRELATALQEANKKREEAEAKLKRVETVAKEKMRQKDEQITKLEFEIEGRQPPTQEQKAQAALQELTLGFTGTLAHINTYLREAYATVVKAEKIENVNVQQLSDWIGQFYENEIKTFRELSEAWLNEIDNAGPMPDWRISDLK